VAPEHEAGVDNADRCAKLAPIRSERHARRGAQGV
jgi:hypothetical protein